MYLKPLGKSVLIPLGLAIAVSAPDAEIHKDIIKSGMRILLIINKELDDLTMVKPVQDSG